ncbi:cell wall hydrolase [Aliibacillus thermotolerans]|uniref:Cell wall hydrolase n=1 Tax=Aliibacillus thermotolerans TaxID=1834418 RepID=A0ABW0U7H7_9BACI|nr:cell wall hydrolase [Aliibacillus thermotolerans]
MKKTITHIFMTSSFIFVLLFIDPNATKATSVILEKGNEGPSVVQLQETLIHMGYLHTNATGYYGTYTTEAVKAFQQEFGLLADGKSGPQTLSELENVRKIAKAVHGEARGESFEGQVAVAAVIRNRLLSPEFPSTVDGVIKQKNAFTAVQDGQYYLDPSPTAFRAVREAWRGWDPSYGSHYYYNPNLATSEWIYTRTVSHQIGNHVFAN